MKKLNLEKTCWTLLDILPDDSSIYSIRRNNSKNRRVVSFLLLATWDSDHGQMIYKPYDISSLIANALGYSVVEIDNRKGLEIIKPTTEKDVVSQLSKLLYKRKNVLKHISL